VDEEKLTEWELVNVNLETWGPFGRGWSNDKFSARAISAAGSFPVIAYPKAWTPGTKWSRGGRCRTAVINNEQELETLRGQLRGKYVMITTPPNVQAQYQAPGRRYTEDDLQNIANQNVQPPRGGGPASAARRLEAGAMLRISTNNGGSSFSMKGVIATIETGQGRRRNAFVQSGGDRTTNAAPVPPQVRDGGSNTMAASGAC